MSSMRVEPYMRQREDTPDAATDSLRGFII
jgi:hypothetical protein